MMRNGPRRIAHLGRRFVCDHRRRHKLHNVKPLAHKVGDGPVIEARKRAISLSLTPAIRRGIA